MSTEQEPCILNKEKEESDSTIEPVALKVASDDSADILPQADVENLFVLIEKLNCYHDNIVDLCEHQRESLEEHRDLDFEISIVATSDSLTQLSTEIKSTMEKLNKNFGDVMAISDLIKKYGKYSRYELMKIIEEREATIIERKIEAKNRRKKELHKLYQLMRRIIGQRIDLEKLSNKRFENNDLETWENELFLCAKFSQFDFDEQMAELEKPFLNDKTPIYE